MSIAAIREQIKTILSGVAGIGVIHDYERWSIDWNKFLDHYKDSDGRINGCAFAREKCVKKQMTMGETEKAHVFVIRRITGLKDSEATGIIFDDHLEILGDAFKCSTSEEESLNGTCRTINPDWGPMADAVGLQIEIIEPRMVGGVLCHYAECRLCVIEAQEN